MVDALGGSHYKQQHLQGALPLVEADVAAVAPSLLQDKTAAIVTYCSNPAGPNSQAVANLPAAAGFTNVRMDREGIQDRVEAGLPTESGAFARI